MLGLFSIGMMEGKFDESNYPCPSFFLFSNLQTGIETGHLSQSVIYFYCAIYILGISAIYQVHEGKRDS